MWGLTFANFEPTVVGPHTNIGCLSSFSIHCVKFVLLCSSSEKTFAKINLFSFFGSYIVMGKKGGNFKAEFIAFFGKKGSF